MTVHLPIEAAERVTPGAGTIWRNSLAALAALSLAILILFRQDAVDMVEIWLASSTYNHCLLILPIIAWLVWQRLPELGRLTPRPWIAGLLGLSAGAFAWLLGDAGGVGLARHFGLVLMLQAAVVTCLGPAVSRAIAFPLCYAFFLVPTGEELVPLMQTVTAEICMFLLALFGVPAHIEGIFITTPTGYFEVAEACSGVRFLVAMAAYGALVANVCFRSWPRRIAFVAASILIPILANGIRAWGTIYIAHLTDISFAAGFDHVIYGWIFFAVVIALLMAAGWRFFDRRVSDPWFDPEALEPRSPAPASPARIAAISFAALALAALPLGWSALIASSSQPVPNDLARPVVAGWQPVERSGGRMWAPHFAGADLMRVWRYRDAAGNEVDLAVAVFARQEEGRELVGFGQGAVGPESQWAWSSRAAPPAGGRADRISSFGTVREVVSFYRVGRITTGSEMKVKLETMKTRLLGGPQRAVALLVSAPAPAAGVDPRPVIDSFLAALGPVDRFADRAAGMAS